VNNEEKCTRLELENAELREALADKLVKQTLLKRLVAENGEMKLEMEGGACRLMAETFGTMLLESKAANYIETMFELGGVEGHPKAVILVTVQRGEGKTPHQLRTEAEQARDESGQTIRAFQAGMPVTAKWPKWASYCRLGANAYWFYYETVGEDGEVDPEGKWGVAGAATEGTPPGWEGICICRSQIEALPSCLSGERPPATEGEL
jgi:hypothetical protein